MEASVVMACAAAANRIAYTTALFWNATAAIGAGKVNTTWK